MSPRRRSSAAAVRGAEPTAKPAVLRVPSWRTPQAALAIVAIVVATGALHWAQAVAVPIATALLLAFLLAPLVAGLERRLPSPVAAVLVVLLTCAALGGVAWILGTQLMSLAEELPQYRGNILARIADLRGVHRATGLDTVQKMAKDVVGEIEPGDPGQASRPMPVTVERPFVIERLPSLLHSLAMAGFVVVLVMFMLLRRRDARNRIIALVGHRRLAVTTKALDEMGQRITRYLVRQSLVNVMFGALVAAGLLLIGVPYAALYGALAATLRFVPYVGTAIAALAPTLVSLAIFPGWTHALMVIGMIAAVELAIYMGVEPWLCSRGAGLSEIALLIAIAFWTWLWGPVGLVLATPMTVCLVVLSKNLPALRPIAILLDKELGTRASDLYYQRLVARDESEAWSVVNVYLRDHTHEELIGDVLFPAVRSAKRDREREVLADDDAHFVYEATARMGAETAPTLPAAPSAEAGGATARTRLLACPARDEADETALRLLTLMLGATRTETQVVSHRLLVSEILAVVEDKLPDVVCIGALPPGGLAPVRYLVRRLRAQSPGLAILVVRWSGERSLERWKDELSRLGVERLTSTLEETRADIGATLRTAEQPIARTAG